MEFALIAGLRRMMTPVRDPSIQETVQVPRPVLPRSIARHARPGEPPRSGGGAACGSSHAELLEWLAEPGCSVCRRAAHAESRFVVFFVTEGYADWRTSAAVRAAMGFCPAHTRLLLRRPEASWVMRTALADAVGGAIDRLDARHSPAGGTCPLCRRLSTAEGTHLRALVHALADPEVAAAYEASGGCCVPHALAALAFGGREAAALVTRVLRASLACADWPAALPVLCGLDRDVHARRVWRERLQNDGTAASRATPERPVLPWLRALLARDACPLCAAAGAAESQHLAWLAGLCRGPAPNLFAEGVWLCAAHTADLAEQDAAAGAAVAGFARRRYEEELARLVQRIEAIPPRGIPARLHAVRRALAAARRDRQEAFAARALVLPRALLVRDAVTPLRRTRPCSACMARDAVVARTVELLIAALDDAPTARAYERAHGLCAAHALSLPAGRRPPVVSRVLRARLGVAAWELEEAWRKAVWPARHERTAAERTAWLRAPAIIDGRAYLGARPGLPPERAGDADRTISSPSRPPAAPPAPPAARGARTPRTR